MLSGLGFRNMFGMLPASSSKAAPRPSCGGASTASYPDVLRRVAAATRPRDGGSPSGESDASATSAAMVTQEEDDLALPGDSPLWEFLGALVRAEAAILGDAADEERRRLDATPGPRGKAASLSPLSSLEAARRTSGHQFLNAPEPTEERPRKRQRVTFASSELSALDVPAPVRVELGER